MAEFTGKNLYAKFGSTAMTSRYRNFEENEEVGLVDKSAGNDIGRGYLVTLEDGTASLEVLAEEGGTALWAAIDKGNSGTLEWGEEGTASGKPKHTVPAIVKSRKRTNVYEDVTKLNFEFQYNGVVVDSTY